MLRRGERGSGKTLCRQRDILAPKAVQPCGRLAQTHSLYSFAVTILGKGSPTFSKSKPEKVGHPLLIQRVKGLPRSISIKGWIWYARYPISAWDSGPENES